MGGWHFKDDDPIGRCHKLTKDKGWTVFAIGYTVECFTTSDAETTYQRHGPSTNCLDGVGLYGSIQVYKIRSEPGMLVLSGLPFQGPFLFFNENLVPHQSFAHHKLP